jgi:hypothetical protein
VRVRPWASIVEVPTADGLVFFKACEPQQAFEARLTAQLAERWPDRVTPILAHDDARGWLLMADAGRRVGDLGNPPEIWERVLPRYAELQIGERSHVDDHLAHGVLDLRVERLPAGYATMLSRDLPLAPSEVASLRGFESRFAALCGELRAESPGNSIQHDDLHVNAVFLRPAPDAPGGAELRVLDWGDASIGHPFFSPYVTFRFLELINRLVPADPWFARLRDAYLEPWGRGLVPAFDRAMRIAAFAHCIAWLRHRDPLEGAAKAAFDEEYAVVLRRAIARIPEPAS